MYIQRTSLENEDFPRRGGRSQPRECEPEDRVVRFGGEYGFCEVCFAANELAARYPGALSLESIGRSYLGRDILCLRLGALQKADGIRHVIYIGAHHALERITSQLLLRFCEDAAFCIARGYPLFGFDTRYLAATRCLHVVPMLNPDGVELALHGLDAFNPARERILRANGGSADMSRWQANARGVDLNHNYNAAWEECRRRELAAGVYGPGPTRYGGEYPESEPEVAALCNYIRAGDFAALLALHTQGEEIYWQFGENTPPQSEAMARQLARLTGYTLAQPDPLASCGGCKDWFIDKFARPGFTFECGRGTNPLPPADALPIYTRIREALAALAMMR